MAEIYESENLKNYYAPQKPVDTTPTRSSLSQQVCKLEGWNFACMLKPCSSTYGNFLGKFWDGRVSNFKNFWWFDTEWHYCHWYMNQRITLHCKTKKQPSWRTDDNASNHYYTHTLYSTLKGLLSQI